MQATFFIKRGSDSVEDDEMPTFLETLSQLGLTLDTYDAVYSNHSHPNAIESLAQYNASHEPSPKRQKVNDGASTSQD